MRLKCVNIVSADPIRLAGFYGGVLGLNIDETHGGPDRIEMWCGDSREQSPGDRKVLVVVSRDEECMRQASRACRGFEFQVPDVDAEYRRMRSMGVEVKEPPRDLPWGYRYFTIEDPDGNTVDIVQAL